MSDVSDEAHGAATQQHPYLVANYAILVYVELAEFTVTIIQL